MGACAGDRRMSPVFTHIKPWTRPDHYMGKDYTGYYPVYALSRDDNYLEQSNFDTIRHRLGGDSETVLIERSTHWACGYVDVIYVHESDTKRLLMADRMLAQLDMYPVLDEDDYDRRVHEATLDMVENIKRCPDCYPDRPADDLYEYARTLVND